MRPISSRRWPPSPDPLDREWHRGFNGDVTPADEALPLSCRLALGFGVNPQRLKGGLENVISRTVMR